MIDNHNSPRNIIVKISAFWAFVHVFSQYYKNTNTVIEIRIKSSNLTGKITDCVHDEHKIYIAATSTYNSNVVCSSMVGVDGINQHAVSLSRA